jgi:hypothetical protein
VTAAGLLALMTPGRLVDDHDALRPVRVLGFAGPRLDHHFQHPYPVVLQKDTV